MITAKACTDIVTTMELASLSTPKMSITTTEFLKNKDTGLPINHYSQQYVFYALHFFLSKIRLQTIFSDRTKRNTKYMYVGDMHLSEA